MSISLTDSVRAPSTQAQNGQVCKTVWLCGSGWKKLDFENTGTVLYQA